MPTFSEIDPYAGDPDDSEDVDRQVDEYLEIATDLARALQLAQEQADRYMRRHPEADRQVIEARFRRFAELDHDAPDYMPHTGYGL